MKSEHSFLNFIRTGAMGPLQLCDKFEKAISYLGNDFTTKDKHFVYFNSLVFTIFDYYIYSIGLDFSFSNSWPAERLLSGWYPTGTTTLDEFKKYLESGNIKFQETIVNQEYYITTSLMEFLFEFDCNCILMKRLTYESGPAIWHAKKT